MAIKGGINYGMLDKAMTDWNGIIWTVPQDKLI